MKTVHAIFLLLTISICCLNVTKAEETDDSAAVLTKILASEPDNTAAFQSLYNLHIHSGRYTPARDCARNFRETAYRTKDPARKMLSDAFLAQAFLAMDAYDSAKHYMDKSWTLWQEMDSTNRNPTACRAFSVLCNSLGIYHVTVERNYEKAIAYFFQGQEMAEKNADYFNYAILGSNRVVTYNLLEDTTGLQYALEIYRYGQAENNAYMLYTGSYVTAMMYFLKGDIPQAERYIRITLSFADRFFDKMGVYCLYADILAHKDECREAENYYKKAIRHLDEKEITTALSVYLSYSRFLIRKHRYREALAYLKKGIALAEAGHNRIYTYRFYELAAEACEKTGNTAKALTFYRKFHDESTDINGIEQERAIRDLNRKYENERYEKEIRQKEMTIARKSKVLQLSVFCLILILGGTGVILMLYRNKNRLYLQMAGQYKELIDRKKTIENGKYATSSLTEGKNNELFAQFETLMQERKCYKEKNLTRERIAELLDTNRTYLSQVINEKTGMSVLACVNAYRISEALETLSDANNDIPLKALSSDLGFCSLTTFYKMFQQKTGMTPAKYREKILLLAQNGR